MSRRLLLGLAALVVLGVAALAVLRFVEGGDDGASVRPSASEGPVTETLDEQVARIAGTVEGIRGLEFVEVPEPTAITPSELSDRVAEELQSYTTEDAAEDRRILEALGVVTPGTDLRALIIRGYSEQVGGFYDPETGELVVGAEDPDARLGRLEEIILAHELQHALADEALGLPELEEPGDGGEDRILARQALTEGDATITMQRYIEVGFSIVDQLLLPGELTDLAEQLAGFTELPHYIQRSFTFPYEEGAVFVNDLIDRGGWEAVDAAYDEPPTTTAEILFPDRYPTAAATVTAPPTPGADWELARESGFGAADLLFLFEAPGNDPSNRLEDPLEAAGTWTGGVLHLYTAGDRSAVGIVVATDGSDTLCAAMGDWYDAAHSDDTREETAGTDGGSWEGGRWSAELVCADSTVSLGIAPTPAAANALVGGS